MSDISVVREGTASPKERKKWRRSASHSVVTNRGDTWYNRVFTIPKDGFGLDLGSGESPYAPANIIRLDYLYREYAPETGQNVAALFQELPFADESFDFAVASWSLAKLRAGSQRALADILRVIKPGGNLQVYPTLVRRPKLAASLNEKERAARQRVPATRNHVIAGLGSVGALGFGIGAMIEHGGRYEGVLGIVDPLISGAGAGGSTFWILDAIERYTLTIGRSEEHALPEARETYARELLTAYKITGLGLSL
jgi:SAM-dependent methyltransferase